MYRADNVKTEHRFNLLTDEGALKVNTSIYYTTKAVRGPITKTNQSDRSIAGPWFSKYWTGYCPEWSRVVSRFQPEIKMADDSSFVSRCFCCWSSIRQKEAWNNSGRKTSISRLFNGNFSKHYASESGHKNIKRVLTRASCFNHPATSDVRCTHLKKGG